MRRSWAYTLNDIAVCSGVSVHTVRDHVSQGLLDPNNLIAVSEYIAGNRSLRRVKDGEYDGVDIWGNPVC